MDGPDKICQLINGSYSSCQMDDSDFFFLNLYIKKKGGRMHVRFELIWKKFWSMVQILNCFKFDTILSKSL
jgi:hypothetical protein